MKKIHKSMGIVGLLGVLVAAGVTWKLTTRSASVEGPDQTQIFSFAATDIQRFSIKDAESVFFVERNAFGWAIQEPCNCTADATAVENFIRTIASGNLKTRFGVEQPAPEKALTGLSAPQRTIVLWGEGKAPLATLSLGNKSTYDASRYVEATLQDGASIEGAISGAVEVQFLKPSLDTLRERSFLGLRSENILALKILPAEVSANSIEVELRRDVDELPSGGYKPARTFQVVEPPLGNSNRNKVQSLIASLYSGVAIRTLDPVGMEHREKFGLENPEYRIEVTEFGMYDTGKRRSYSVLWKRHPENPERAYYGRDDESWVNEIGAQVSDDLELTIGSLESTTLFEVDRTQVHRLEIDQVNGTHWVFEKSNSADGDDPKWRLLAPEPANVRQHLVVGMLMKFTEINGDRRAGTMQNGQDPKFLKECGLDKPVIVRVFSVEKTDEIHFASTNGKTYARLPSGSLVIEQDKDGLHLPLDLRQLREAKLGKN